MNNLVTIVLIFNCLFAASCGANIQSRSDSSNMPSPSNVNTSANVKNTASSANNSSIANVATHRNGEPPIMPDPKLTPGDSLDVTRDDICTPGYSKKVRNVPQSVKEQAYAEYGITSREPGEYEVDHLISLELGGSNSLKNLWPESFRTEPWNARVKDKLENKLHEMICAGQIEMKTAQREIASNWIEAYKKHVAAEPSNATSNRNRTSSSTAASTTNKAKNEAGRSATAGSVVGNKNSHIYHRPDCPDYDKISPANRVEFASAAEAEQAGYRLAGNCKH